VRAEAQPTSSLATCLSPGASAAGGGLGLSRQGVDDFEHGLLIGRRQRFQLLESAGQVAVAVKRQVFGQRSNAQKLVGGRAQRPGQLDQNLGGRVIVLALVVRDHAAGDTGGAGKLVLSEAGGLALSAIT